MDDVLRFIELLRSGDGVPAEMKQILATYRKSEAPMSKDKDKSMSETDEPWKAPQPPDSKSPPKRDPETTRGTRHRPHEQGSACRAEPCDGR